MKEKEKNTSHHEPGHNEPARQLEQIRHQIAELKQHIRKIQMDSLAEMRNTLQHVFRTPENLADLGKQAQHIMHQMEQTIEEPEKENSDASGNEYGFPYGGTYSPPENFPGYGAGKIAMEIANHQAEESMKAASASLKNAQKMTHDLRGHKKSEH